MKAKAKHFMQAVAKTTRERRGIWLLATMAETRTYLTPTPPSMPNLVTPSGNAATPSKTLKAMKAQFLPPKPAADIFDIPNASYLAEMLSSMSILKEDRSSVIKM